MGRLKVEIYNGTTWVEEAKLTASDGSPGGRFGSATGQCQKAVKHLYVLRLLLPDPQNVTAFG